MPHTPAKRWGYGAAALLLCAAAVASRPYWAAIGLAVLFAVRLIDVQLARRRRGGLPTERAYFFESDEKRPSRREARRSRGL